MFGYIYKNTCLVNGKIYIGLHKYSDNVIDEKYWGSGPWFKNAFKKYGINNFIREIIDVGSSLDDLSKKEIYWISYYYPNGVPDKNIGYNQSPGGYRRGGYKRGPETTEKWKATVRASGNWPSGSKNPNYGHGERVSGKKNGRWRGGVLCVELNKVFETAKEASEYVGGKSYSHIVACCNGKREKIYGYSWKWLEKKES